MKESDFAENIFFFIPAKPKTVMPSPYTHSEKPI